MFDRRQVRVRVTGWEQVAPELGRPQQLINPLVHECDVFVGLLNRRWGSETGTHSSGFEEEFEVALARRVDGPDPAIGMFFAEIPPDRADDPGAQLQLVLKFQERVRREHVALYRTFRNVDHLAVEILEFLTPHVLRIADEADLARMVAVSGDPGPAGTGALAVRSDHELAVQTHEIDVDQSGAPDDLQSLETSDHVPDEAQAQIAQALRHVASWFETSGSQSIDRSEYDRVVLVSSAFSQDGVTLGLHHVDRLYKRRAHLSLTVGEAYLWYRTYFANYGLNERDDRTVPIWGVIGGDNARFLDDLVELAVGDNLQATLGCLRYATAHCLRPAGLWPAETHASVAPTGCSEDVAKVPDDEHVKAAVSQNDRWRVLFSRVPGVGATLNYLATVAEADDVPFIRSIAATEELDDESRTAVEALALALEGTVGPLAALTPSRHATRVDKILELIAGGIPTLDIESWGRMVAVADQRLGCLAAVELAKHGSFTDGQLKDVVAFHSRNVENAMVERASADVAWGSGLVEKLQEISKIGQAPLIARILAVCYSTDLLEEMNKVEQIHFLAWEALMVQDPRSRVLEARAVLDGTSEIVEARTDALPSEYKDLAVYVSNVARRIACDTLAQASDGEPADITRVATELRRGSLESRDSALHALVAITTNVAGQVAGSAEETAATAELAKVVGDLSELDSYWASGQAEAVLGNTRIAPLVAQVWRDSEISALRDAAQRWELSRPTTSDADLEEALYLEASAVRMGALDQLLLRWGPDELLALLNRYGDEGRQYWYNVIAALDEHLYAHGNPTLPRNP